MIYVFWGWSLKAILSCLKSTPFNLCSYQISWRSENVKIWDQKYHFCVYFTQHDLHRHFWVRILKTLLSDLKSAPWKLSNWKNLAKKIKYKNALNLGPKMPFLGIFNQNMAYLFMLGLEFLKYCCQIWNHHLGFCQIEELCEKQKHENTLNFGPKCLI